MKENSKGKIYCFFSLKQKENARAKVPAIFLCGIFILHPDLAQL